MLTDQLFLGGRVNLFMAADTCVQPAPSSPAVPPAVAKALGVLR